MSKESETIQRLESRIDELQQDLYTTRDRLVRLLEKVTQQERSQSKTGHPFNFDSPDFDVVLNKQIDDWTITKGIISKVYWGRVVSIHFKGDDGINIYQQSHHLLRAQTEDNKYEPIRLTFSKETFLLLLDAMKYAEEKFGLDRKAIVEELTGGSEFHFREGIVRL